MLLFPPPGKLRSSYRYVEVLDVPVQLWTFDPSRVLAYVAGDTGNGVGWQFSRTRDGFVPDSYSNAPQNGVQYFWGPEEMWAYVPTSGAPVNGSVWVYELHHDGS